MSGSKINDYGVGDVNLTSLMETLDATRKRFSALTITQMETTTIPAIAAGSMIEVNGAMFAFDSQESISTTDPVTSSTVANGTVYIMLIPSGDTITAAFTATAPTWSDSKQGWYGTGSFANNRYIEQKIIKNSSAYYKFDKIEYIGAEATKDATQSITSSGYTKINYEIENYDFGSNYSTVNSRYTVDRSGLYQINGGILVNGGASNEFRLHIYKNGSQYKALDFKEGVNNCMLEGSVLEFANSGDYYELYMYSDDTSYALPGSSAYDRFSMIKIDN